jgi:hypothetical protein
LAYRLFGWREMGNPSRAGHYWVNDKYPGQTFSLREVAKVIDWEILDHKKSESRAKRVPHVLNES